MKFKSSAKELKIFCDYFSVVSKTLITTNLVNNIHDQKQKKTLDISWLTREELYLKGHKIFNRLMKMNAQLFAVLSSFVSFFLETKRIKEQKNIFPEIILDFYRETIWNLLLDLRFFLHPNL